MPTLDRQAHFMIVVFSWAHLLETNRDHEISACLRGDVGGSP
jgi:hypothetical protein